MRDQLPHGTAYLHLKQGLPTSVILPSSGVCRVSADACHRDAIAAYKQSTGHPVPQPTLGQCPAPCL